MKAYFRPAIICLVRGCGSTMAEVETDKAAEGRIVVECANPRYSGFELPYIIALPVLHALVAEANLADPGTYRCVIPPRHPEPRLKVKPLRGVR
jgi:hypothetical protein